MGSDYDERLAQEISRFDSEVCVHDLPEIFHYWSNKYLRPRINRIGYQNIEDFFAQEVAKVRPAEGSPTRVVSVGAGDCSNEIAVMQSLLSVGRDDIRFLCLDISGEALSRARVMAQEAGLEQYFAYDVHDFNTGLPDVHVDVVIANQSLHHVVELETLYQSVRDHIGTNGCFLISDMIGRNGHQRWPEAKALVDEAWEWLPSRYRYNWQLKRQEDVFMDWDCSKEGFEGIRAQDVLPLLMKYFSPAVFLAWSNIIDVFIDRGFGHNFHAKTEWDLHFIDRIEYIDQQAIKSGRIKPTHLLARFQNESSRCIHAKDMPPEFALRDVLNNQSSAQKRKFWSWLR